MKINKLIAAVTSFVMLFSAPVFHGKPLYAVPMDTEAAISLPEYTQEKEMSQAQLSELAEQVAYLVNQERTKAGLAPLKYYPILENAANVRAKEISQYFDHTRPNGSHCSTIMKEFGISYFIMGENIAYGYTTPEKVMNGWMNSSGHRDNILNNEFAYIGVGVYISGSTYYWTQLFFNNYTAVSDAYTPTGTTTAKVTTTTSSTTTKTTTATTTAVPRDPIKVPDGVILGDVNQDGKITAVDASMILKEYAEISAGASSSFSEKQKSAADATGDNKTDARDASLILKYYAYLSADGHIKYMEKWLVTI